MHLRVQTRVESGVSAADILKRALSDIVDMCDYVETQFKTEVDKKQYATS